jgi:hypothetical protein
MGRSFTPKYALDADGCTGMTWDTKRHGTPTAAKLEEWVMSYAKSLEAGGVNAHLSQALGHVPYPRWARVRLNYAGGAVVAEWKAGMFQVYG